MKTPKVVTRLEQQVRHHLIESGLTNGVKLVAAVSGGPDSLALLIALNRLSKEMNIQLHGAHLDHGIRGAASNADARFVTDIFLSLGIGLTNKHINVPSHPATQEMSLEEAAREVRYSFLAMVAANQNADAIAVGHTRDDQVETVIMNIIRGSGLTGLRGMTQTSRRSIDGREIVVVRPLLHTPRVDTEEYCRVLGLDPRTDESNLSTKPRRNKVRMDILPIMEDYNPSARKSLLRLSRAASKQIDYLDSQVAAVWSDVAQYYGEHISLNKEAFRKLDPTVQCHLIRLAVARVADGLKGIEENHVYDMQRLMDGKVGQTLELPRGIIFTVGYRNAIIGIGTLDQCPLPFLNGVHQIMIPGEAVIDGWHMQSKIVEVCNDARVGDPETIIPQTIYNSSSIRFGLTARFGLEEIKGEKLLRTRIPGDRFQPLGMSGSKKIQDFMVDNKIPRAWRDRVPILSCDQRIAWVVGWRIANWARVKSDATKAVELRLAPHDST